MQFSFSFSRTNLSSLLAFYLFILITILQLQNSQAFNPRIKCFHNRLIFNYRYTNWELFLLRNQTTFYLWQMLVKYENLGTGHQRPQTSNISSIPYSASNMTLSSCKNLFPNGQSCCNQDQFESFTHNLNSVFNTVLNNTKYPIVQYLYNLIGNFDANKCPYTRIYLPGMPGYNSSFDSQPINSLVAQMTNLLNMIINDERKFINQTACLVCMGTKDFTNFMFPNYQYYDSPMSNYLIYERNYFINRVNGLTTILTQLQSFHVSMTNLILSVANSLSSSASEVCQNYKAAVQAIYINNLRICKDTASCRAVVVQRFGLIVLPQLTYFIKQASMMTHLWVGPTNYCISNDPDYGFKGNTTYNAMYGNKFLPNVTLYLQSNSWSGL